MTENQVTWLFAGVLSITLDSISPPIPSTLNQESENYSSKTSLLPAFVSYIVLEYSHLISLYIVHIQFCAGTELNSHNRDQVAHKDWNIYHLYLLKKADQPHS